MNRTNPHTPDDNGRGGLLAAIAGLVVLAALLFLFFQELGSRTREWQEGRAKARAESAEGGVRTNSPELVRAKPRAEIPHYPMGYQPNPAGTQEFLRTLDKPLFKDAAKNLYEARGPPEAESTDKEPVLLYRALYHVSPGWRCGKQGIGDCVSWGWAHGCSIASAVEVKLGNQSTWKEAATEPIYGGSRVEARGRSKGGWSDGSYGGAAAKWVKNWGVLFREHYDGCDLSTYSAARAKDWGNYGCGGKDDNGRLDQVAKQWPIKTVALVASYSEAAKAIENGYPVPVCSGQGFSSTRDADGFAKARGSWSHCMVFIGVRYAPRPGLLCLNSWGEKWIDGPRWPADQPQGSFWVEPRVADKMLRGRDSFAVSAHTGFPARKLDHRKGW